VWLAIAKGALLLFLAVGVTVIVVTYRRKSRTVGSSPPDPNGYLAHFSKPSVPLPEWVHWTDDDTDDNAATDKGGQPHS
jgi:hypothetical protein